MSDLFKTRHDFDFGPRQMSTLASRIAPLLQFFDLMETETALPEIETDVTEIKTALPKIETDLTEIEADFSTSAGADFVVFRPA